MIEEDYVSFETAKLLKEKGFDENTHMWWYTVYGELGEYDVTDRGRRPELYINAPTLQMAMKWLREVYDIHVVPRKDFFNGTYTGMIYDGRRENVFDKDDYIALVGYETYEQTCEDCIKYCLENLI